MKYLSTLHTELMEISTSHCQTVEPLYTNSNTTTYCPLREALLQSCQLLAAVLCQLLTGLYLYSCIKNPSSPYMGTKCNKSTSAEEIQTMDSQVNTIQLLLVGALYTNITILKFINPRNFCSIDSKNKIVCL